MRKFIIILVLLFSFSLSAERAYLLPSRNGELSEIVPITTNTKCELKMLQKNQLSDYKDEEFKGGMKIWLLNTDNGTPNYYLSGIEDVDTFMVWFVPTFYCSVLAYEVTNIAILDTNQKNFTMFLATLDQSIDYANDFPEYHSNPPPSSHRGFATVIQSIDTTVLYGDSMWTIIIDTLNPPIRVNLDKFAAGWVKARGDSSPNPYIYANGIPTYHTLMYRDRGYGHGWYSSWHCVRIRALITDIPGHRFGDIEDLPDSYTKYSRTVNMHLYDFGVPVDSSGIKEVVIKYQVNSGPIYEIPCTLYSGDSTDGYWKGDIPGVLFGDTVEYWAISTDYQNFVDTSIVYSYIIREGTPGNFLFVDNGYTESNILPDYWIETCDVWDYYENGPLDSSVYAFYNTVVIRDWGSTYLGDGSDYGAGILYSESTWVKQLLDRGGNFWLSDQDQGYGFGICPDFGVHDVPANHWVQQYLGIQGMYDDHPQLFNSSVTAYGNPNDSIIGYLFKGIGFQNPGEVYVAPYYALTGSWGYSYTGSFDSLQSGAVVNMRDTTNDLVISYRYTGPSETYKVYNDFYPWDFIAKPGVPDTLDLVAIDSLVEDVLGWFGYTSGVSDRALEPEKVIKLFPVGITKGKTIIKFYLPEEMLISLSIYDKTGRLIRKLMDGKANAGLNTVRWDGKDSYGNPISSGVYFYQLIAGDKTLTNKVVMIK